MKQLSRRSLRSLLLLPFLLLLGVVLFLCCRLDVRSEITRSSSVSVLISTYSGIKGPETDSFVLLSGDSRYMELSDLLQSVSYRRRIGGSGAHTTDGSEQTVSIDLRYYADTDLQLFMELWSDGAVQINEYSVSPVFFTTDGREFFRQVLQILDSEE